MDPQSLRHLHALRDFVRNLVEQAERSEGCECHRPPSLLLVGPPGAGKTYLVKQMSNVCEMPLFGVHTHQLSGPLSLRNLFLQARDLEYPSLFFLDDIDYIFSDQDSDPPHDDLTDSLRNELYKQLGPRKLKIYDEDSAQNPVQHSLPASPSPKSDSGFHDEDNYPDNNGLILVAATSSPWLLYKDHELLSRFRGVYLVGLPDRETRFHMLKVLLQKVQHNLTEKDFWIIADKTEGYTPSDLMVITKSLNYEQFSFLFSMAGLGGFPDEGTSEDGSSESSSEMTESDTDSNYDPVVAAPPENSDRGGLLSLRRPPEGARGERTPKEESPSHSNSTRIPPTSTPDRKSSVSANPSTSSQAASIAALEKDWSSGEEEEEEDEDDSENEVASVVSAEEAKRMKEEEEKSDDCSESSDGANNTLTASENEARPNENSDMEPELSDDVNASSSPVCDNRSNSANSENLEENEDQSSLKPKSTKPENECDEAEDNKTLVSNEETKSTAESTEKDEVESVGSDNEVREFELRVSQPPDPFPNDNQAIDSGSDSDNENNNNNGSSSFSGRGRRVNFGNVSSMHALSVEVEDLDIQTNNNFEYAESIPSSNTIDTEELLGKASFCGPSSSSILKQLLEPADDKPRLVRNDDKPSRSNTVTIGPSPKISYAENEYHDIYSTSPGDDVPPRLVRSRRKSSSKSPDLQMFSRISTMRRGSASGESRSSNGTAHRDRSSPQLTPTGSVDSVNLSPGASTDSGSGRIRMDPEDDASDNETTKTRRDSNSSLYGKSETNTIASSESSSATCNVSGETLECRSDAEERLRNLEEDLKERRPRVGGSVASEDEDDEDDEETSGDENDALRTILKLNNLGEVSIKILTLTDVLSVISRTPRSVNDEEIKRYTDFMVWFANVAKSACPHSTKGAVSDSVSSMDADSVDGSLWNSSTATQKKRKGPLKKLGRFLLKALMFILD